MHVVVIEGGHQSVHQEWIFGEIHEPCEIEANHEGDVPFGMIWDWRFIRSSVL